MDGIPIPCTRCGAPMSEVASPSLVDDPMIACAICRRTEPLPRNHAERVRALQARLAQLRLARQAAEAPQLAVARLCEHRRSPQFLLGTGSVLLACGVNQASTFLRTLRTAHDVATLMGAVAMQLVVPGILVGMMLGQTLMTRQYRKALRPLLLARPARHASEGARCRSCGGELPAPEGVSVVCRYCAATNFFGPELTQRRDELLAAEARSYRQQADGWARRVTASNPAYQMYLGLALGGVLLPLFGVIVAYAAVLAH